MLDDKYLLKYSNLLMLCLLLFSCQKSGIKIIDCNEIDNIYFDKCIYEHGSKITSVRIKNTSRDTIYFSSHLAGSLKIITTKVHPFNGIAFPNSGDYWEINSYSAILLPFDIQTYFICDTVPEKYKNVEYRIDYKIRDKENSIWVSPN